jgi:hypothetical protein
MKKKLPVVTVAHRDEAARLAQLPAEATIAMQDVAEAIKDGLMAFCCSAGLAVVAQLIEAALTEKLGPKGRHAPEGTARATDLHRALWCSAQALPYSNYADALAWASSPKFSAGR